jgi:hypothetical protein
MMRGRSTYVAARSVERGQLGFKLPGTIRQAATTAEIDRA